jgi:hypothetical protein
MPVRPPRGAEAGIPAVTSAIGELVRVPGFVRQILGGLQVGVPAVTTPHTVHNIGLDALAEGRGLDAAQTTGLGYLVLQNTRVVASAEVALDERGEPQGLSNFSRGQELQGTLRVLELLDDLPDVRNRAFELRMLRIPALHVRAVWLKDQQGDDDLVLPIGSPDEVRPRPIPAGQFLDELRQRATEVLSAPDDVEF